MKSNFLTSAAGAVLVTIATFLPWVSILGISANGWARGAGAPLFIICCAAVGAIVSAIPKKWVNVFTVLCALILIMISGIYISDTYSKIGSAGIGIWLLLIGSLVLLAGGIMGFLTKKTATV